MAERPTSKELFDLADRLEAIADHNAAFGIRDDLYPVSMNDEVLVAAEQYAKAAAVRARARALRVVEDGLDKRV